MNLSIKQKALFATFALFAGAVVFAYLVSYIVLNVSTEVLSYAVGAGLMYFFASMIYQVMLSKFEFDEKMKDLVDKK